MREREHALERVGASWSEGGGELEAAVFLVPIACCGCFADWQGLPSSAVVPDWCCLGEIFRYRNKYAVRPYCPFDVVIQKHGEPAANATIFPGEFCGVDRSVAGGATGDYNGDGTAKTNPKKTPF